MIKFWVENKTIFANATGNDFSKAIKFLADNKCKFNPIKKAWEVSLARIEYIIDTAENHFEVEADTKSIEKLLVVPAQLKVNRIRNPFDESLMRLSPFKGKAPNEDYQLTDIKTCLWQNRYGLFLDQGLGKSYIIASVLVNLLNTNKISKALIVTSGIGVFNIYSELLKFTHLSEDDLVIANKNNRMPFIPENKIVICNYITFRLINEAYKKKNKSKAKDCPLPLKEWFNGNEGLLVLDESHQVGIATSKQTQYMLKASNYFEYRYLSTGTPTDKPEKLYSQYTILDPYLTDNLNFTQWKEKYAVLGTSFSAFAVKYWKKDKLEMLHNRVQSYSVRRLAKDHIHLPEHIEKKVFLPFSELHKKIYQSFVKEKLTFLQRANEVIRYEDVDKDFMSMNLSIDNPELLLKREELGATSRGLINKFRYESHHSKWPFVEACIDEHLEKNDKGILWVTHPLTANELSNILTKKGVNHYKIIGETSEEDRQKFIKEFKESTTHNILIASVLVLNTSITLTECSFQIYVERPESYTMFDQSKKRIYRIGQDKKVFTYIPIINHSLDTFLDKRLINKETLNNKLTSKNFLSTQEWNEIFQCTD